MTIFLHSPATKEPTGCEDLYKLIIGIGILGGGSLGRFLDQIGEEK